MGLKLLGDKEVESHLANENRIGDAAYEILKDWYKTQGDDYQAWNKLVQVLSEARLQRFAVKALGAPE